ncbi:competence type IV pilus assembly protein ComGB [Metabacillus litoralis]|uniref:competence type IV pilus assembly protein ComGB n=1 Tax=Metabacillus litoralis TaxID=152268 RepID=UPI00203E61CC|nr:competence type IV pilus assembly protein ComGB [Metabacillus litoralis]MCM3161762.1 type II secretion system F family protein [Metabacillus litoralis]
MKIKKKWNLKDQLSLLKRLSSLLDKGYTLNEALQFLHVNEQGYKKADLQQCISYLSSGNSFRTALSSLHFHRDVLSYLYFAEQHGDLEFSLKECSGILDKKLTQFDKLTKLLRYPIFLLSTVAIILLMIQFVITPQFEQLYASMNIETSFFSLFLLIVFNGIKLSGILLIVAVSAIVYYFFSIFKKQPADAQMNTIIKIPILKRIFVISHSYFFALQLSNLLKGGMSTFESLKVFESQNLLPFFKVEAGYLIQQLRAGEQLHHIIGERCFYEKELSLVILHGQANGQLSRELYTYSQLIIDKLEQKMVKIMEVVQPAIYGFVGMIVLFVYLSMLLPMYKMMESL